MLNAKGRSGRRVADVCVRAAWDVALLHVQAGDILIDGGNEWYHNSIARAKRLEPKGILYLAMGVSGGEYGARHGPSLMPGGPKEAFDAMEPIISRIAAQTDDGPCTTYIGGAGSGNYVKMVHNGIEYGDMQLIAEAYDVLHAVGVSNDELAKVFKEWNEAELNSYLIEITAAIMAKHDRDVAGLEPSAGHLIDKILDASGQKGTGKMTVQEAADRGVAAPTIAAALDQRFLRCAVAPTLVRRRAHTRARRSSLKEERIAASAVLKGPAGDIPSVDRGQLVSDVRQALFASKICSYAQGARGTHTLARASAWTRHGPLAHGRPHTQA